MESDRHSCCAADTGHQAPKMFIKSVRPTPRQQIHTLSHCLVLKHCSGTYKAVDSRSHVSHWLAAEQICQGGHRAPEEHRQCTVVCCAECRGNDVLVKVDGWAHSLQHTGGSSSGVGGFGRKKRRPPLHDNGLLNQCCCRGADMAGRSSQGKVAPCRKDLQPPRSRCSKQLVHSTAAAREQQPQLQALLWCWPRHDTYKAVVHGGVG